MMTEQQASVDAGDLNELEQAAEAWAGYLRARSRRVGDRRIGDTDAADRIDQALQRVREAGHGGQQT